MPRTTSRQIHGLSGRRDASTVSEASEVGTVRFIVVPEPGSDGAGLTVKAPGDGPHDIQANAASRTFQ